MSKIRGLAISDLHFGIKETDRLYDELKKIFLKYVKENGKEIDVIFINGDTFDKKLLMTDYASKAVIRFVNELLVLCKRFKIKVRMVKGTLTHDFNQLENFRHLELQYDFRIINTVETEELFPDFYVLYLPEEYMENADEYYQEFIDFIDDETKYDIIVGHGTFDIVAFESQKQESERLLKNAPVFKFKEWADRCWGMILFGHIHSRQFYKDKLYYSGSFTRWCHGEPAPKGFLDFTYDLETLEHEVKFVENYLAPSFLTVNIEDIYKEHDNLEDRVKAIKEFLEKNHTVRIKINDKISSDELAILKEHFADVENINIDTTEKIKNEIREKEEEDSTFDFIVKREYDIPTTIQKFIQITQNKYIEKELIEEIINSDENDNEV